jgi:hypothetical protein
MKQSYYALCSGCNHQLVVYWGGDAREKGSFLMVFGVMDIFQAIFLTNGSNGHFSGFLFS